MLLKKNIPDYTKELIALLKSKKDVKSRRQELRYELNAWSRTRENLWVGKVLFRTMNLRSLFRREDCVNVFFKFALQYQDLKMVKLFEANKLNIHEVRFNDGKSAIHFLGDLIEENVRISYSRAIYTISLMRYFLNKTPKNYGDAHGYTYLYAACRTGHLRTVRRLAREGVSRTCVNACKYSPLHVAAWFRYEAVVKTLLAHGANPNQLDADGSTPLHALARPLVCICTPNPELCDYRRSIGKVVRLLVESGAKLEAKNRHGDTPLQLAVSRFNVELVKALLKHGASLSNVKVEKMFGARLPLELKNNTLTYNIVEVMRLLRLAGYRLDFNTRLRMVRYWMKVRGNDVDHMFTGHNGARSNVTLFMQATNVQRFYQTFGFFIQPGSERYMEQECSRLASRISEDFSCYEPAQILINKWIDELKAIRGIMITEDVPLGKLCRMNYYEAYSILKKKPYWHLPPMKHISCRYVNIFVKRHLANVLIKSELQLCVVGIFIQLCRFKLPYEIWLEIVAYLSDEDMFCLCYQTRQKGRASSMPLRSSERLRDQGKIQPYKVMRKKGKQNRRKSTTIPH